MIKNIIIDFGNVIYKVDLLAAHKKFYEIAKSNGLLLDFNLLNGIIDKYECGKINTIEFRDSIRNLLGWEASDEEFDLVWNSILIEPFEYSEEAINKLAEKYNLFLLSNTSPLHFDRFFPEMKPVFDKFKKLYFVCCWADGDCVDQASPLQSVLISIGCFSSFACCCRRLHGRWLASP